MRDAARTLPAPIALAPALMRRSEAAAYCGRSVPTWDRLVAAGRTPKPIRLAGGVLMRRSDLDAWIGHGCPDRKTFETLVAQ